MSNMIFKDNALKYWEAGLNVIPLGGKVPKFKGWQEWSLREQTEEELEWLLSRSPDSNIGTVCGQKFCVLDVDTDDPRVLQAIPYTPLRRRGRNGRAGQYFYRACELENIPGTHHPVELLNHGRQVVLPPSVHPDTGEQYQWVGEEDVFTCDFETLPILTRAQFLKIIDICKKYKIECKKREVNQDGSESVCLSDVGRNNRLASVAYAMACDAVEEDEAVKRLIELDKNEHDVPWFSDKTEPHRGRDPQKSACKMYTRAVDKSISRGDRLDIKEFFVSPEEVSISKTKQEHQPKMPKPRGLIAQFQAYCNLIAFGNQDALGIGGALAMMSAITSNRFRTRAGNFDVWPNLYIMNLAHSGFGKETPQRALDDILMETGLLGSATYKSGSSIVMGLAEQPHRLDIIDECAMLLKAMTSREDYKSDIVDVLSSLYSKSATYFHGYTSKGDGKNFGACWNPCVNLLGSTTPQGFRGSVNKDMAAKGLMPRFLVFWQKDIGDFKRARDHEKTLKLLEEIKRRVRLILQHELAEHPDSRQKNLLDPKAEEMVRYDPEFVPMTEKAEKMIGDIQERYFNEGKENPEGFESAFKNRFAQHIAKLALLDAVGLGLSDVDTDSVQWAHDMVKWQWESAKELYELASAENEHEKLNIKMLSFIKSKSHVLKSDLTLKFRMMPGYQRKDIVNSLLESGAIEQIKLDSKGGRKPTAYRAKT